VKIVIQSSALADLADGFDFYERNELGLGGYFLDSLYSDIDSLQLYAGIHAIHFGKHHRLLSKRFPCGIYYQAKKTPSSSAVSWICAATRNGSSGVWGDG
jgi:hypothetical protein